MKVDSFVDFPKSNASDELLEGRKESTEKLVSGTEGPTFEYFSAKIAREED